MVGADGKLERYSKDRDRLVYVPMVSCQKCIDGIWNFVYCSVFGFIEMDAERIGMAVESAERTAGRMVFTV